MNSDRLKSQIENIVARLQNGEQVEGEKIELKSKWYNFKSPSEKEKTISEFVKDIASIANTPGPDGMLIIGIDEKTGKLHSSPFKDCGLRDLTDLRNLIVKHVDLPIRFEFNEVSFQVKKQKIIISVLIIPPSLDKPHVIRSYTSKKNQPIQNYIPVRKATGIYPANRSDLEFMFYDRKNIEPEYALDILAIKPKISFNGFTVDQKIHTNFILCFSNYGRKPIALTEIKFIILPNPDQQLNNEMVFNMFSFVIAGTKTNTVQENYLIIPSNQILNANIRFKYEETNVSEKLKMLRSVEYFDFLIEAKDLADNLFKSKQLTFHKDDFKS